MAVVPQSTVIVPVYNGAETLTACIASLLALRPAAAEIIIVDNGSTDATRAKLAAFGEQVCVVYEPRPGAAAARNAGVRHAQGKIIAFTDADCVVDSSWLAAISRPLADPSIGVVGGRNLALPHANRIARFGETIFDHRFAIECAQPPFVASLNWASRKRVLLECGLFDTVFLRAQDVELSYRIRQAGYALHYQPDAVIYHHNPTTWRRLIKQGFRHGYHVMQVYRKHDRTLRRQVQRPRLHLFTRRTKAAGHDRLCQWIFTSSRLAGKAAGAVRYRTLDL